MAFLDQGNWRCQRGNKLNAFLMSLSYYLHTTYGFRSQKRRPVLPTVSSIGCYLNLVNFVIFTQFFAFKILGIVPLQSGTNKLASQAGMT